MAKDAAVAILLELLDEAFDHSAWHGTNLRGAVRRLDVRRAAWRPGPGRHNAWEVVVHAAYWKYAVRRQLTGEKRGSFPEKGSNWFPRRDAADEAAWRRDLALLVDQHLKLRAVVATLRAADLRRRPPGSRRTIAALVRGAASHDLYHAGQIQLLKKLEP
jgi:hypothetical protein